ncbi:hypothetical protein BJV77DRAFT_1157655 [Russula vinacea]|nr:hypothetical protein BJV77DRAFT_1157655 [Russula vinacea]
MPVFRNGKRSSPFVSPPSITITGMPGRGFENRRGGTHVAFGERRDDVVAIVETGAEERQLWLREEYRWFKRLRPPSYGQPDTDSDHEVYGQRLGPSGESLNGGRSSAQKLGDFEAPQYNTGREPYPAWGNERSIPLSKEEIEDIFLDLRQWQRICCFETPSKVRSPFPSTAARLSVCRIHIVRTLHPDVNHVTHHLVPSYALTPAHMTCILSAAQLVKPEWLFELLALSILDPRESTRALEHTFVLPPESKFRPGFAAALPPHSKHSKPGRYRSVFVGEKGLEIPAEYRDLVKRGGAFDFTMHLLDSRASCMSPNQALLTLHVDYIGGLHANYRKWYFAAQLDPDDAVGHTQNPGYESVDGKFVQRERDHDHIIGYDDVNQLFWYPEGIARIVLTNKGASFYGSIARSFMLGLSIWMPWRDIYAQLPKRIYSRVLVTSDLEVRYEPKVLIFQIWKAMIISMPPTPLTIMTVAMEASQEDNEPLPVPPRLGEHKYYAAQQTHPVPIDNPQDPCNLMTGVTEQQREQMFRSVNGLQNAILSLMRWEDEEELNEPSLAVPTIAPEMLTHRGRNTPSTESSVTLSAPSHLSIVVDKEDNNNTHPGEDWIRFIPEIHRTGTLIPISEAYPEEKVLACYIRFHINQTTGEPTISGTMGRGCPIYGDTLMAAPVPDPAPANHRNHRYFEMFEEQSMICGPVNRALEDLDDYGVLGDVIWYRGQTAQ